MAVAAAVASSLTACNSILSSYRILVLNPSICLASRLRIPKQQPPQCLTHSQTPFLFLPFSRERSAFCSLTAASAFDGAAGEEEAEEEEGDYVQEEEEEEEEEEFEEEREEEEEIEELKEKQGDDDVEEKRRLFVGNLPYSMTSSQLGELFREAGQVDSVEIIYDRVTDRSRGFAFLMMGSFEEAKRAIHMFDGSQAGGRTLKVNFPEVPRGGEREVMGPLIRNSYRGYIDSPYKVYAGNLSWILTSQGLKDAFEHQPGFMGAKVIYERVSGRSRGFGFVSFSSLEEAEAAVNALNGVEVEGRPLRLNLSNRRTNTVVSTQTTHERRADSVGREMQSTFIR